ncbi:MAG TPA: ABC transporter substrate-binding protein [Chloroflexota bacterium]|nr:ABC transporter substrate-binding protein [Chloroflexota bacterium]
MFDLKPTKTTAGFILSAALLLSACGGSAASSPASSPGASSAAAQTVASGAASKPAAASASTKPAAAGSGATSAKPAGSGAASAAATGGAPEKTKLQVGIAAPAGSGYMVLRVAADGGYFAKHGLDVTVNTLSASTATQALISGQADMYQGGATAIGARLKGADLIYIAATVDKNDQMLIGQKGITTWDQLKGKKVATTSPGAFGEIAMRKTAKERGLTIGTDIQLLYHPTPAAALTTFYSGNADAFILSPPQSIDAKDKGYPVIIDYYKEGLRIIGPGMVVSGPFYRGNPNTIKAYLEGYLDGLKRALDDPAYAKSLDMKYNQLTDPKLADGDYEEGLQQWNKDMTVNPEAIQVVLDAIDDPAAKTAKTSDFYDNTAIEQVNKEYGSKLFPNDIKA